MTATLWTPDTALGPASVWMPGLPEVIPGTCSLPQLTAVPYNDSTFVLADNFTGTNGTNLVDHEPDVGPNWVMDAGGAADMQLLNGSVVTVAGPTDEPITAAVAFLAVTTGKLFGMSGNIADYSKNLVNSSISWFVLTGAGSELGICVFTFTRATVDGPLQVTFDYGFGVYGSGTIGPTTIPDCTWVDIAITFDFESVSHKAILVINGTTTNIPLVEEGWNETNVGRYTTLVNITNIEEHSFRIANLGFSITNPG